MKRILTLALAALMVLSLFAGCGDKEGSGGDKLGDKKFDGFAVGYSKVDITPDPSIKISIMGNNDHNTRLSTGVLEPIMVNCITFTDTEGETVLVYGTDLHGVSAENLKMIREQLTEKTGIPGDHIQMTCSHNHCGPMIPGANNMNQNYAKYGQSFIDNCVKVGIEALESRKPAKMYTTFTRPEDMVFVRHYLMKDGTIKATGSEGVKTEEMLGFLEKGDNLLQMVKFVREGEKDVILFNWQGHPFSSTQNYYTYLSGVSPAIARRVLLEKADTESIYIMGGSGNNVQQPAFSFARKFQDNVQYGEALADAMIAAFDSFKEAETGKIYYTYTDSYVPPSGGMEPYEYVVSAFGFGDFGYVTAPSEMFQSNAISVRDASPWKYTIYAQLSNGTGQAYVPDAFTYTIAGGAYERRVSKTLAGDGEGFAQKQLEMLNDIFKQSGQTVKEKDEGYITVEERNTDGLTYTNPNVGGKPKAANDGYYQVTLVQGGFQKTVLVKNEQIANKIMGMKTMKLYTNYSGAVVDAE